MNIVIGMIIVLYLMVSEMGDIVVVDDVWNRLWATVLATLAVPALALSQVTRLQRKKQRQHLSYGEQQKLIRKMSANHSGMWLVAGLFIVGVVKWQDVVRGNWELDRWVMLDEAMILAPLLFALIASWAVFYELQRTSSAPKPWYDRFRYVALHVRVYVAIVMVPIAVMVLLKDCSHNFEALSGPSAAIAATVTIIGLLALFPFAMLLVWRHKKMEDSETRTEINEICSKHRMNVFDIRIWNTGNQVVNAVVAGTIPRLRILMLSDGLLRAFPQHEVAAIVRHEAGHVRLGHLQIRILFVMLPIIAIALASLCFGAMPTTFSESLLSSSLLETKNLDLSTLGNLLGIAAYLAYVFLIVGWLSRKMEFEADLFAIGAFDSSVAEMSQIEPSDKPINLAQSMVDALLRFAQDNPDQYEKRSLTHPSIRQRIDVIARAAANRESAIEFRRQFVKDQIWLGATLVVSIIMIVLMFSGTVGV